VQVPALRARFPRVVSFAIMSKQHFFVRLIPPRPTFPMDMTPEEKSLMQKHVVYTHEKFAAGKFLIFGPVMAPTGAFGMAVFEAADEAEVRGIFGKRSDGESWSKQVRNTRHERRRSARVWRGSKSLSYISA